MSQTKTAERAERSLRLLDEAERHLEADDLYKACEKGLGGGERLSEGGRGRARMGV